MNFFKTELLKIKTFVFDVDGVLARQELIIDKAGNLLRTANSRDGFAIRRAIEEKYPVAIITGGFFEAVKLRYKGLGVSEVYLSSRDKVKDLKNFIKKNNCKLENVLYMGDDLPDFKVMKMVGVPVCPGDAAAEIKKISKYVSDKEGGKGCVRDVIEQVMRAQDKW